VVPRRRRPQRRGGGRPTLGGDGQPAPDRRAPLRDREAPGGRRGQGARRRLHRADAPHHAGAPRRRTGRGRGAARAARAAAPRDGDRRPGSRPGPAGEPTAARRLPRRPGADRAALRPRPGGALHALPQGHQPAVRAGAPAGGQVPRRPGRGAPPPGAPEPIVLHSDPGLAAPSKPSPKDSSPGFVKAPPPGAKYRSGTVEEGPPPAPIRLDRDELPLGRPRRAWRGPALLVLMLLVAGFAAYLAWREPPARTAAVTSPFTSYLVDVAVEPAT